MQKFKDDMEVIFCINSADIEKSKIRADYGISYELELLRLIDAVKELPLLLGLRGISKSNLSLSLFL